MRVAKRQYAPEILEEIFQKRGMTVHFWENEADYMLHALVKPDLGQARSPHYFSRLRAETTLAHWYGCWWARLLRWIYQTRSRLLEKWMCPYKKPFQWVRKWTQFPHWLIELIFANQIKVIQEKEKVPEDILERIRAMSYYLIARGIEPTRVIIGAKVMVKLYDKAMFGFSSAPYPFDMLAGPNPCVFDLEIQNSPFLAEDAIIVC